MIRHKQFFLAYDTFDAKFSFLIFLFSLFNFRSSVVVLPEIKTLKTRYFFANKNDNDRYVIIVANKRYVYYFTYLVISDRLRYN